MLNRLDDNVLSLCKMSTECMTSSMSMLWEWKCGHSMFNTACYVDWCAHHKCEQKGKVQLHVASEDEHVHAEFTPLHV